MATIVDYADFDPQADCEAIHDAMDGLGTDEDKITEIITYRSNAQRQEIKVLYAQMFGEGLEDALKSELGNHYEDVVLALFKTSVEYQASEIHDAIKGLGTDEGALIEILCTSTNQQIEEIKETYNQLFEADMVEDIDNDMSGNVCRLLYSLAQAARSEDEDVDDDLAVEDAEALIEAGEASWGTDESRFNVVLASRSFTQLAETFSHYAVRSERSIIEAIESEMSGDVQDGMLAIVDAVYSKTNYFAKRLYNSMKGAGTDDRTLIRVMVSRSEVDLADIRSAFQDLYEQSLEEFIENDCSGDYKRCLLQLAKGNNYCY